MRRGIFPEGYPERWRAVWRFASWRFVAVLRRFWWMPAFVVLLQVLVGAEEFYASLDPDPPPPVVLYVDLDDGPVGTLVAEVLDDPDFLASEGVAVATAPTDAPAVLTFDGPSWDDPRPVLRVREETIGRDATRLSERIVSFVHWQATMGDAAYAEMLHGPGRRGDVREGAQTMSGAIGYFLATLSIWVALWGIGHGWTWTATSSGQGDDVSGQYATVPRAVVFVGGFGTAIMATTVFFAALLFGVGSMSVSWLVVRRAFLALAVHLIATSALLWVVWVAGTAVVVGGATIVGAWSAWRRRLAVVGVALFSAVVVWAVLAVGGTPANLVGLAWPLVALWAVSQRVMAHGVDAAVVAAAGWHVALAVLFVRLGAQHVSRHTGGAA